MNALRFALLVSGVWVASLAAAQPTFVPEQHIYTVPDGFIPEKLSVQGLQQLEATADRLHYPFYVVFYRDLPTASGSSTDQDSERAVTGLADAWAQNAAFDRNRSTIFVVSYGPGDRKFRLMPAPRWRTELGLEGDALARFHQYFRSNARRDPQSGISMMMTQYDSAVYDRVDPVRVAELTKERLRRKQESEISEATDRLRNSQMLLGSTAQRAKELGYDSTPSDRLLAESRSALGSRDIKVLNGYVERLQADQNLVRMFVDARESQIRAEFQRTAGIWAVTLLLGGVIVITSIMRLSSLKSKRARLASRIADWRGWITEARQRYYVFDQNRDRAIHLKGYGEQTEGLYRSTVKEIDDVIIGVEAIANLLDAAERRGKLGSFLTTSPLDAALDSLDRPFKFETDRVNHRLFEPQHQVIEVRPADFLRDLSTRYDAAVNNWQRLNDAVDLAQKTPAELFPHSGLDELMEEASANGIPQRWLATHPLFGDDESDRTLYERVGAERTTDPVAYARLIEGLREQEATLRSDLDRLIAAQSQAQSHLIQAVTGLEATVLAPDDDPKLTLSEALNGLARLPELLHTSSNVNDVVDLAARTDALFLKTASQIELARDALRSAKSEMARAGDSVDDLRLAQKRAEDVVKTAASRYSNASPAVSALEHARSFTEAAEIRLRRAEQRLGEKRHLEAVREAEAATAQVSSGVNWVAKAEGICQELDRTRILYEHKLQEMERIHGDALRRMRRYGGSTHALRDYYRPTISDRVVDYAMLYALLQQQEDQWNRAVVHAQASYEAAQSASSSSSSSWGSSSSSFDSGSSGGSFSSGDSGSSGGSW